MSTNMRAVRGCKTEMRGCLTCSLITCRKRATTATTLHASRCALHKDEETGLVVVDADVCIGCGYCHMACPYNSPQVDRSKGVSVKCDGCISRVREGRQPVCVESCSLRCLEFGPIEELRASYGNEAGIAPLPDPEFTHPNLVVTPPANARSIDDATGHIANKTEVL